MGQVSISVRPLDYTERIPEYEFIFKRHDKGRNADGEHTDQRYLRRLQRITHKEQYREYRCDK